MPSLIGNYVAQNYRQQIVPFSRFGTRKVAWFKIGSTDVADGDGVLDMQAFNTVIDAIQTRAEIVMVGAPYIVNDTGWNKFMVAVFEDTMNDGENTDIDGLAQSGGPGYNAGSTTLQDAIQEATGDNSIYVERFWLYGAPSGGSTDPDCGFAASDTYQEFDTKAQFLDGYTQG